jgi:hypothetical protein
MTEDWYAPNQQAVRADGSGPAEEGDGGSADEPETPSLDQMTKDELLAEAEARGVDADASMTKAQIREAIGA